MQNFLFSYPTTVHFGKGQVKQLPRILPEFGRRVLLTYGGGSIKRTGLYDQICALLDGFDIYELGGIDPNPRLESVIAGADLCRKHKIDVILAVGGGSTIDCSKAIAAAAHYEGDPWQMILNATAPFADENPIRSAVPIVAVLTLPAAGSETNFVGVISNMQEKVKTGFFSRHVGPKHAILDPELTFTLPPIQTAAGAADTMSHLFEPYFAPQTTDIASALGEALMRTVIRNAPTALAEPQNYEARANLMWASSLALSRLPESGSLPGPWCCHAMEHELSAWYDITHAVGLAILTPRWMTYILNDLTVDKFVDYGVNVWGLDPSLEKRAIAEEAIARTYDFFAGLGLPMTLSEVGIGEEHFREMATHAVEFQGLRNFWVPLDVDDVVEIFRMCA